MKQNLLNLTSLSVISDDLILEIGCKLKQSDLKLLLTSKKIHFSYLSNKKWVTKNIVNSYNLIFTDLSNILFIKNKKVNKAKLMGAAMDGELENVKFLIKNGVDIHANEDYALRLASQWGHIEVVKLLINHGADIHAQDSRALTCALIYGHLEIIQLLLDFGANLHSWDDSALVWASEHGYTEIVRLLLDRGSDMNLYREAALEAASKNDHIEVVKLLKNVM